MRRGTAQGDGGRWRSGRFTVLTAFAILSGSCSEPEPSARVETPWIFFRETTGSRERQLSIQPDGSYYTAVLDAHLSRNGALTSEQIEGLGALVSEEQFDAYEAEAADNCAPNQGEIQVTTVSWFEATDDVVHMRNACWLRDEVHDERTLHFLETIGNMQADLMNE